MATKVLTRSIFTINRSISITKQALSRSYTSLSLSTTPPSSSISSFSFFRQRPLFALAASLGHTSATAASIRGFATRQTTSSLNDSSPNWSNRPPKETILLDGCDFEHWLVVMEKPEGDPVRDEIIDSYIKTLAQVVGSEEEARMKIYSVSTRCYYAFGALVSEELSYKIKELPKVRWVLPDSYLDVRNKDYGGEPFINGMAVPYDPKYHEEWVRNNARANERNRRNDRPRNFDRSRNFERRRENMQQNRGSNMEGGPPPQGGNMGGMPPQQGNMGGGMPPPQGNMGGGMSPPQGNMGGGMPPPRGNMGGGMLPPQGNMGGGPGPNMGGMQQGNMGGPPNAGGMRPNNMGGPPPPNYGEGPPQQNYGVAPQQNYGGPPPPNYGNMGGGPGPNFQQRGGPNSGVVPPYQQGPPRGYQNPPPQHMGGGNPYSQAQDMPGRDNY